MIDIKLKLTLDEAVLVVKALNKHAILTASMMSSPDHGPLARDEARKENAMARQLIDRMKS